MGFYTGSLLLTTIVSLLLGGFVYLQGRKKLTHITLALLSLSIALWSFGQFVGEIVASKAAVLFWTRVNIAGAVFIPVFYFHFVLAFLKKAQSARLVYAGGLLLLLFDFTPWFVADVAPKLFYRYYPVPGVVYAFFAFFLLGTVAFGLFLLTASLRASSGFRKNQIIYVLLASAIGFAGGVTAFFPVFNISFPPISHYSLPLCLLVIIYAILKHQVVDITLVVRRGLVYTTLMVLFGMVYVGSIFFFQKFFQAFTGYDSLFASGVLILTLVVLLEPARRKVQKAIDQLFFRNQYNFQKGIRNLTRKITSLINLQEWLKEAADTLEVESATVLLQFEREEALAEFLREGKVVYLEELEAEIEADPYGAHELWEVRKSLAKSGVGVVIPLIAKGELVGALSLGKRVSGESYTQEDLELLLTLGGQLAVAIENARLYREVLQTDKLRTAALLAAGMAHEIKNPLAAIKGLSQVLAENLEDPEFVQKFTDIVPRQLDRINSLIEDLLKFSKPTQPVFQTVDINELLEKALKLVENQRQKQNVIVDLDFREAPKIKADSEQLTQAFLNIILNALQAMPNGGRLNLVGRERQGKVVIEISDTGTGISEDKLDHIFDPFFTTKEKGIGLGLAITRRIIKEHQGSIEVQSQEGEGTNFRICLPIEPKPSV